MSEASSFYTSVDTRGDSILLRGYSGGRPFAERIPFKPSLYYPTTDQESGYSTPEGMPLSKKTYGSISEMKESIKTFEGVTNHKYYGTTNVIRQFIADTYPGEVKWTPGMAQIWFIDIETTVGEAIEIPEDELATTGLRCTVSGNTMSADSIAAPLTIRSQYEIFEGNIWKKLEASKYRVKGFPKADKAREEIQLVTLYNYSQSKGYIFSTKPIRESNPVLTEHQADFRSFSSERLMLQGLVRFFCENTVDVLSGWNSELFDIVYLVNRTKRVLGEQLTNLYSPWKIVNKRHVTIQEETHETYELVGISHLDYLNLYKQFIPGSKESFKLDFIADLEIESGKVENPYESFYDFYSGEGVVDADPGEDAHPAVIDMYRRSMMDRESKEYAILDAKIKADAWNLFVEYNFRDATLLRDMETKLQLISTAMMLAYDAKINIVDVESSMRLWESTIYNHFLEMNQFQQANAPKKMHRKIPGAYVHPPIPDKYRWVVSIDAESLYPSVIMQNNISPEMKVGKIDITVEDILAGNIPDIPPGVTMSGNGVLCKKGVEGFIPLLIRKKFDQRKAVKKQMLEYETEAQVIRDELARRSEIGESVDNLAVDRLSVLDPIIRMMDVKQKALKVAANAFYGILLLKHFQHYDPDLGEAVTLTGQVAIRTTLRVLNEFLNKTFSTVGVHYCIALDTDSVVGDSTIWVNGKSVKISDFYDSVQSPEIVNRDDNDLVKEVSGVLTKTTTTGNDVVEREVKYVMKHKVSKRMYRINFNGNSVEVTEDHGLMVMRNGSLVEVRPADIISGDKLISLNGGDVYTTTVGDDFTIEDLGVKDVWVYDIEVDETHTFFANSILVHNSAYMTLDNLVKLKCQGMTDAEIVNYLEKFVFNVIQPVVNRELGALMAKLGVDESRLRFKLEGIGPSAVFIAKKRYAFNILYNEGVRYEHPKMKVTGMEIVRSSTPSAIKDNLKAAVKTVLEKEEPDLQRYLSEVKQSFMSLDYRDISFPRGCNGMATYADPVSIYAKGTPAHVRGALLYNHYILKHGLDSKYPLIGEGEKIKFVYLKMPNPIHENIIAYPNKLPPEFGLLKYIDYQLQYEKAFIAPIESVLDAVGWSLEEKIDLESFM